MEIIRVDNRIKIERPWGQEIIWAKSDKYVGKLLCITEGHRLSLQYHQIKHETLSVVKGTCLLHIVENNDTKLIKLEIGDSVILPPNTVHRIEAMTYCMILEASTPELDDIVRLEDDYGRV